MVSKSAPSHYVLGLDIGDKRIGVAIAHSISRIPRPLKPITVNQVTLTVINQLVSTEDISIIVIGIPRNLAGQETAQSQKIRDFARKLAETIALPIAFCDESLSSHRADEMIAAGIYKSASQDSLAACFILEEYLQQSAIEKDRQ